MHSQFIVLHALSFLEWRSVPVDCKATITRRGALFSCDISSLSIYTFTHQTLGNNNAALLDRFKQPLSASSGRATTS
ncbi:hypothetical protein IAQ61_006695 [Plenodomus lingam]|uniref:uncharacterized protein n=1 Tax=Leptosphaeria maculans TaxID=5022 RepID=UPI003325353C|nr:hypothetical protein IAQ61_006695 [Plenodomus lingam]